MEDVLACGSCFIRFHLELMRQHNVTHLIQSQVELVFPFSHLAVEIRQHFLSSITKGHEPSCTCTAYYSFTQGCALEEYLLLTNRKTLLTHTHTSEAITKYPI